VFLIISETVDDSDNDTKLAMPTLMANFAALFDLLISDEELDLLFNRALMFAARKSSEIVTVLIKYGADVFIKRKGSLDSCLHICSAQASDLSNSIIPLLITAASETATKNELVAFINHPDNKGFTALHYLAMNGSVEGQKSVSW